MGEYCSYYLRGYGGYGFVFKGVGEGWCEFCVEVMVTVDGLFFLQIYDSLIGIWSVITMVENYIYWMFKSHLIAINWAQIQALLLLRNTEWKTQ